MQTLTIQASTIDVADGQIAALRGFQPEMHDNAVGGYDVTAVIENAARLASILNALESYVTQRHEAVAIQLNGHRYILGVSAQATAAETKLRAAHV